MFALALLRLGLTLALAAPASSLTIDLDADGQPEAVSWDGSALVFRHGEALLGRIAPPAGSSGAPRLAGLVAAGLPIVDARWPLADGQHEVHLVVRLGEGGPLVVFSGTTGPVGDGERQMRLRVDEGGIVRYQTALGIDRCDGDAMLFPEAYDAGQGRFRPVSFAAPADRPLTPSLKLPDFGQRPPVGLFRFTAASSEQGDERRADRLAPPRAIDDGRADTAWYEGTSGFGRGVWLTARARAPEQAIVGVKLEPAPGNRLHRLALLVGENAFDVVLPEWRSGAPLWLGLPAPVAASCLTLILIEADTDGGHDTGIAEVGIYTRLDEAGGLEAVTREVIRGAPGAASLAQILAEAGAAGIASIARALPSARGETRQRFIAALAASGRVEAVAPLVDALSQADEAGRAIIGRALDHGQLGRAARPALFDLATSRAPLAARLEAIRALARQRDAALARRLLELHLAGQLGDESALDQAVGEAAHGGDAAQLLQLVTHDLSRQPRRALSDVRLIGLLAPRTRQAEPALDEAGGALAVAWSKTTAGDADFELRFRILRAAGVMPRPALLPMVEDGARADDEVLRGAAMEAAAALGEAGEATLLLGAGDVDPRVRQLALEGLAHLRSRAGIGIASRALTTDRWPMVRETSAEFLGQGCPGASAVALEQAATQDRTSVRLAALTALGRCDTGRAALLAARFLADNRAATALRNKAAALALALHLPRAGALLAGALDDILDNPLADHEAAELATSLARGLGILGDPAGEEVLIRAAHEPLSPAIRAAAVAALAGYCSARSQETRLDAVDDDDEDVRQAARASSRCPAPSR